MHSLTALLAKLGWIEGKNFVWEPRYANYREELLPGLAAELVRLDVDVILAVGTQAPLVAKQATTRIPIVIFNAGDAVELGFAASLARPGGNITGLSWVFLGLSAKRLQFLTEMLPGAWQALVSLRAAQSHERARLEGNGGDRPAAGHPRRIGRGSPPRTSSRRRWNRSGGSGRMR